MGQEQSLVGHMTKLKPIPKFHRLQQLVVFQGFSLTSAIGHSLLKFLYVRNFSDLVAQIVRLPFLACNIWISTVVYSVFSMPFFIL